MNSSDVPSITWTLINLPAFSVVALTGLSRISKIKHLDSSLLAQHTTTHLNGNGLYKGLVMNESDVTCLLSGSFAHFSISCTP
ncbi:hypothetical protein GDO81_013864 [Engystomops pustulosus]|uniref:Uncharacterized protein n=1 Tax=Engystomops pustulosus TaxID=76066 RepID=A0AAV7B676_ENGPU|nr:hypothetical protein GDO81_013864 [Engystomops pustulosus]